MDGHLQVFREFKGSYQFTGSLTLLDSNATFAYAVEYLNVRDAQSISLAFPLREKHFTPDETRSFFEGLLPEGDLHKMLAWSLHLGTDSYPEMLARLNNESTGALVFSYEESSNGDSLIKNRAYVPFSSEDLVRFSRQPRSVALESGMASRLSLAGAQAKLGLYHVGTDPALGWFLPMGSAPSTHIIKASDGSFPYQIINEALCLLTANYLGFATAESFLIPQNDAEPLLAVKRFDRTIDDDTEAIDGLNVPRRLHQEDFCQAAGLLSFMKYEPTDGNFLNLASMLLSRSVANPFGDRMMFFNRILFDFLIGNCDNHLKNHSILWSANWRSRELSPLYDITCTTFYPELVQEMGISLCSSRKIGDITRRDILSSAESISIDEKLAWSQYKELCEGFLPALKKAEQELIHKGYKDTSIIADFIRKDAAQRLSL